MNPEKNKVLQQEIEDLRSQIEFLKLEKNDLEVLLETTLAHADLIETELHESNQRLKAEVFERERIQVALEASQANLKALLRILSQEKKDLEIILETTVEHGDFVENQLHKQTICDPLTGLFNRRYLERCLIREVKKADDRGYSFGVIMVDIDHFKKFNDTFGHKAGDRVLKRIGTFLLKQIRSTDIACRYGGEELTVILPEAGIEETKAKAEKICEGVKQLQVQYLGQSLGQLTVSVGVACFPEHGRTGGEVIQAADAALYLAKTEGRDRVITAESLPLFQANLTYERCIPQQFLNFLDRQTTVDFKHNADVQKNMTVLFADIRDFQKLSESMTPEDNFKFINAFLSRIRPTIVKHNGLLNHYVGNAVMALFSHSADDAVKAAIAMLQEIREYNQTRQRPERPPLSMGIAINTSSLILETMSGYTQVDGTVISDTISLASRLQRLTQYYELSLLISHYTFLGLEDTNQYGIRLIDQVQLQKNTQGITIYEVFEADPPLQRQGKIATVTDFEKALLLYKIGSFSESLEIFQNCLQQVPEDRVTQVYLQRCQENMNRVNSM